MRVFGLFLLAAGALAALLGGIGTILAIGDLNRGDAGTLVVFAVVDLFAVVVLMLAVRVLRRSRPIGATGPSGTGPTVPGYIPNVGVEKELDGTAYTAHYSPPVRGRNSTPSKFTISTKVPCDCEFQLIVETWFDKLCKRFGIATEVQTGDKQFDNECYVRSDSPVFTAAYLADPVKRIAILDLRRFGFREVRLAGGNLSATWSGFNPARDHREDLSAEVAARLLLLARNLPAPKPEFANRTTHKRHFWQTVLWIALVCFALNAIWLAVYSPVVPFELLLRTIPIAVITWPMFAFLSAWLISGTSRSHLAWSSLLLGSLFFFPLGSVGVMGLLNAVLDTSPAKTHDAVVVDKYTSRSKNSTKYHVQVASWRKPGETVSFRVGSRSEYEAATPGKSKFVVTTRGGWLGVEWLKSKHLEK